LKNNSLTLFDHLIDENEYKGMTVSWADMVVPAEIISLPLKTEEQSISLKMEYLKWLHEFGEIKVRGLSLISHLKIFNNLSFWWLTSVAEKSPFLCKSIFQVFKLRTLEKIYMDGQYQSLVYRGNNESLHTILKSWCLELGHPYKGIPISPDRSKNSPNGFKQKLFNNSPYIFQGIAWLITRWFGRWRHVNRASPSARKPDKTSPPTIVTFFPNVNMDQLNKGNFRSKYWEKLHDYFEGEKLPVDWVWFHFGSKDPSFKETVKLKDECNKKSDGRQRYFLLEEFLSWNGLWKSLIMYLRLHRKTHDLNSLQKEFCFSNSKMNFFPIMKKDWDHSFFGIGAIEKIIWATMFDAMAQTLPASSWGLYTWENQTWERALISAWKRHQPNRRTIGYEHSSVRLMDLRLFSDSRTYEEKEIETLPIPDMLGLNSSTGLKWIKESGYPAHKITRIEALRYFDLSGKHGSLKKPTVPTGRKLLMVTGILQEEARFQIELLKQADEQGGLEKYDQVWIKPHPGLALDSILKDLKPNFKFTLATHSIIELMKQMDVVYCANSTGASLEAAWLGVPLIILTAMDSVNLNPLFGFPDQSFVKDCPELLSALENPKTIEIPKDYFFLDEDLKSWKEILEL
jgi:surface carbohydrate biosynthesis protein (TIGR04326 family)